MHTMSLRLDEAIAQPALEAAKAEGISFNEYVQRAIAASLDADRRALIAQVRDDMGRYAPILEYLGTH
jgi:hypothetical protein